MSSSHKSIARCMLAAIVSLVPALMSAATVTVAPNVTINGSLYHYDYSIANTTTDDAFLVDISVPANPLAVTNLVAPTGFTSAFDSGLGLVSFLENTAMFGSTPLDGFAFDSPDAPGPGSFQASLLDASSNIYTISGSTLTPVPEPSYSAIFLITSVLITVGLIRRNRLVQQ